MKKLIFIITVFGSITYSGAQTMVKIEKGIATLDGKQWLIVQETQIDKKTAYEVIKTLSGEIIAMLTFTNNADAVYFKGEFPVIAKKYEINYPAGTAIQTILESYNKNKVIVDGNIDLTGLQKYCNDRKFPLNNILTPEERKEQEANQQVVYSYSNEKKNKSEPSDNINTDTPLPKNVSFTLKNNSSKNVRIFIGDKPKYGSGRTSWYSGNSSTSEYGTSGNQVCIVDEYDNSISCQTISDGTTRIEINESGTGFGK